MQNDVTQEDRDAGTKLAEHVLRNLSDKALRDVNPNDVFYHMATHRIAAEAAKDAEIAALQARVAELDTAHCLVEWQESDGPCVWWHYPVEGPSYIGSPLDSDWPFDDSDPHYVFWTPHPPVPANLKEPTQ